MVNLKQVQPVVDAQGVLKALIGLDGRGNVYYGTLTGGGQVDFKVEWKVIGEH